MTYAADPERYHRMPYARSAASGLRLPRISLGLWQNFGEINTLADARVTSTLVGARTVQQLQDSLSCLQRADFSADELSRLDAITRSDPAVFNAPDKSTGKDLIDHPEFRA